MASEWEQKFATCKNCRQSLYSVKRGTSVKWLHSETDSHQCEVKYAVPIPKAEIKELIAALNKLPAPNRSKKGKK